MSKIRFAVIADLHYFSEKLTDKGYAYELRSGSDQKCLSESPSIIDKAFKMLSADNTIDSVLICGDLTNNGEICSHEEIKEKIKALNRFKKVYVITATHDYCCDNNAKVFFGDTASPLYETASILDLRRFYDEFGAKDAVSLYEIGNGLCSYVAKLNDGFRLFALNDDMNGNGKSGYDEKHLNWIITQMQEAKKAGDRIIVMEHHLVLKHYTELLTKAGLCIADRERVAEAFCENSAELLFVGHSHMHNITQYRSNNNNKMVQVNVGSLVGYPAPILKVSIDDEYTNISTEYVRQFEHEHRQYDTGYLYNHLKGMGEIVLEKAKNGDLKGFCDRLSALGVNSDIPKKLFFIEKKASRYISSVNVGSFASLVNKITFGHGINKTSAEEISEKLVMDIAYDIFTNLFDGGFHKYKKGSAEYTVVSDFVSLPHRFVKSIPFMPEKIKDITDEIHELVCLLMDDKYENTYLRYRKDS